MIPFSSATGRRSDASAVAGSHSDRAESADDPFSTCRQSSRSNRALPAAPRR